MIHFICRKGRTKPWQDHSAHSPLPYSLVVGWLVGSWVGLVTARRRPGEPLNQGPGLGTPLPGPSPTILVPSCPIHILSIYQHSSYMAFSTIFDIHIYCRTMVYLIGYILTTKITSLVSDFF